MAPWWLRSKKDDRSDEDDPLDAPADALELIATEEDDDDEDAEPLGEAAADHDEDPGDEDPGDEDPGDDDSHDDDEDDDSAEAEDKGSSSSRRRRRRRRRKPQSGKDDDSRRDDSRRDDKKRSDRKSDDKKTNDRKSSGDSDKRSSDPKSSDKPRGKGRGTKRGDGGRSRGGGRNDERSSEKREAALKVEAVPPEEIVFELGPPERTGSENDERKIALFCDLENIALGVRDSETRNFDISLVLERLLEKGKIIVKKAYADWERYSEFKRTFHDAAIELIDIPQKKYSGKNSADIKMVVDAMDLCYSKKHLDTFVILSGDSDFSPLVSKLKENNKFVIGVGVKNSTSNHLIDNCDEFIYYEDVWRDVQHTPRLDHLSDKEAEAFGLLVEAILALLRENKSVIWGSMVKQTMQRKRPSFSEGYYGYSSFSDLLADAHKKDIIRLNRDKKSGNYVVTGFGQKS